MRRRLAVVAATTVVAGLVPGAAAADEERGGHPGEPSPGAPGIGDPYYPLDGNGGYDVGHYDLDLRYDPATDVLSGTATIEAEATQALSAFNLDLVGLDVQGVTVDGRPATWTRAEAELTVTPERPLRRGHGFEVAVTYSGVPATLSDDLGSSGFFHTDDGVVVAGQPHGAATWFPANDHPSDAASLDVSITVPPGLEGISNGDLEGTRTADDGWTTWDWRAREPMATYLVTLAVGEFDLAAYEADGVRFWDAVDLDITAAAPPTAPDQPPGEPASVLDQVRTSFARQPEVLEFLSGVFGPYPFRTSGGIADHAPELQFALETQTRPVYAPIFFTDPVLADIVVVHELAHQWYGDSVRLAAWQHIWLNEGFATYAEWLWLEREGLSTPQEQYETLGQIPAEDPFWAATIGDPGAATTDLFHPAVYQRGAMTLHALRIEVGDEAFFDILAEWASSRAGQAVTTEEFIELAEKISGEDLDALFEAWLSTPGRPALG
jgi:aminopeptidase N